MIDTTNFMVFTVITQIGWVFYVGRERRKAREAGVTEGIDLLEKRMTTPLQAVNPTLINFVRATADGLRQNLRVMGGRR